MEKRIQKELLLTISVALEIPKCYLLQAVFDPRPEQVEAVVGALLWQSPTPDKPAVQIGVLGCLPAQPGTKGSSACLNIKFSSHWANQG